MQRWVEKGIPPPKIWEICLRFQGDPVQALILLGRITPDQVSDLNHEALVQYAPTVALTGELHRRAVKRENLPQLTDTMTRQSFRLTSK